MPEEVSFNYLILVLLLILSHYFFIREEKLHKEVLEMERWIIFYEAQLLSLSSAITIWHSIKQKTVPQLLWKEVKK